MFNQTIGRKIVMKFKDRSGWVRLATVVAGIFLIMACSLFNNFSPTPTPGASVFTTVPITPTPTINGGSSIEVTPSPVTSRCDGLSGELEMQILVGPADAVGLEPLSVGDIPFAVVPHEGAYLVQGGGGISYQATLEEDWGTYSVSFDMETTLSGVCVGKPGSEELKITVEPSGEQIVEVRAQGFQGDYPWTGTPTLDLSFPLEDGATLAGEGWAFVLHLSK
jgi:hypothetical protein